MVWLWWGFLLQSDTDGKGVLVFARYASDIKILHLSSSVHTFSVVGIACAGGHGWQRGAETLRSMRLLLW